MRTLDTDEGVAYIEFARPLQPSVMQGLRYIQGWALLVMPLIKCYNDHKDYLMADRLLTE